MIKNWAPSEFIPVVIHLHLLLAEPATRHHIVVGRVAGCSSQTVGGSEHFKATLLIRIINDIILVSGQGYLPLAYVQIPITSIEIQLNLAEISPN